MAFSLTFPAVTRSRLSGETRGDYHTSWLLLAPVEGFLKSFLLLAFALLPCFPPLSISRDDTNTVQKDLEAGLISAHSSSGSDPGPEHALCNLLQAGSFPNPLNT